MHKGCEWNDGKCLGGKNESEHNDTYREKKKGRGNEKSTISFISTAALRMLEGQEEKFQ